MFNELTSWWEDFTEATAQKITDARKGLETNLIHWCVAIPAVGQTNNVKLLNQATEKEQKQALKNLHKNFAKNLTDCAKGQWVDQATTAINDNTDVLDLL